MIESGGMDCGCVSRIMALRRVLRAIYSNTKSSVLYDGVDRDLFEVELGVRQGDVISPLLFSLFFNGLIRAQRRAWV
jgi:hypothetical protein